MSKPNPENRNAWHAWNTNAEFWDERMAEGNEFFNVLLWPAVEKLLQPAPGERLLDVACGNGLISRKLAAAQANVTAIDFSAAMIDRARNRPSASQIDYMVLDATDRQALLALGEASFDGALCNMALMDMADIAPLMEALAALLKPAGRFVFSVLHPCFNNPAAILTTELEDRSGTLVTTYSVRISRYLTPFTQPGLAMRGQPLAHPYFHRPLGALLAPAWKAGLVMDALEERAFPADATASSPSPGWSGHFMEIPAALVVRMKRSG